MLEQTPHTFNLNPSTISIRPITLVKCYTIGLDIIDDNKIDKLTKKFIMEK